MITGRKEIKVKIANKYYYFQFSIADGLRFLDNHQKEGWSLAEWLKKNELRIQLELAHNSFTRHPKNEKYADYSEERFLTEIIDRMRQEDWDVIAVAMAEAINPGIVPNGTEKKETAS